MIPKSAARVLNAAKVQEEWRRKRKAEGEDGKPRKRQRMEDQGKGGAKEKKVAMKIMQGESLARFNRYLAKFYSVCASIYGVWLRRRVEESMRPLVREAVQTSTAAARKVKKEEEMAKEAQKAGRNAKPSRSVSPAPQSKKKAGKAPATGESDDEEGAPLARSTTKPAKPAKVIEKEKPKDFATFSTSAPRRLNDVAEAPPELKKLPRGAKASKTADISVKSSASLREGALSMAQKAMLEEERERVIKAYRELKKGGV